MPAARAFLLSAAFARRPPLQHPPYGENEEHRNNRDDRYRCSVHLYAFLAGRNTAQRQKMSTRTVTAVQKPKHPQTAASPIW